MIAQPNLTQLYDSLRPALASLEAERRQVMNRILLYGASLLAGLVLLIVLIPGLRSFDGVWFFAVVGLGGIAAIIGGQTRAYRRRFKREVVAKLVQALSPDLRYEPEMGIGYGEYRASQLFTRTPDRYREEDLVMGKVGQTRLKVSEVHSEYKTESTDSKGRRSTQWHTIFRGLFFILDFPKPFKGTTLVLPDQGEGIFNWLEQLSARGQLVKLEDPEFERMFVVYGSDQVEARYLLSTSLMQRIVEFRKEFKNPIYLSFTGGNLFMALSMRRDLFEPRVFRPTRPEDLMEYLSDLRFALSVVDELNLNTRIWTA